MDAKVITADMANRMMVWSEFGRPNESVLAPPRDAAGPNHGLYPGGYYLLNAESTDALKATVAANEEARMRAIKPAPARRTEPVSYRDRIDKLWKGWVLPATDADTWVVAGCGGHF